MAAPGTGGLTVVCILFLRSVGDPEQAPGRARLLVAAQVVDAAGRAAYGAGLDPPDLAVRTRDRHGRRRRRRPAIRPLLPVHRTSGRLGPPGAALVPVPQHLPHAVDAPTPQERLRLLGQRTGERTDLHPVSYTHLRAHETDSYLVCR